MIRKFAYADFVSYFGDEINQRNAWMITSKEEEYSLRIVSRRLVLMLISSVRAIAN